MRTLRAALAVIALLVTSLGHRAGAEPPGSIPKPAASSGPWIQWKLSVVSNDNEIRSYAFLKEGATVPVDAGGWSCRYLAVKTREVSWGRVETTRIECSTGKLTTATVISCGNSHGLLPGGTLIVAAGTKASSITLNCALIDG